MKKNLLMLAPVVLLIPALAAADVNDTTVTKVRTLSSYLEIRVSEPACSGAPDNWGSNPRFEYSSGVHVAEAMRDIALAAMLSGKKVDITASLQSTPNGLRCFLSSISIKSP